MQQYPDPVPGGGARRLFPLWRWPAGWVRFPGHFPNPRAAGIATLIYLLALFGTTAWSYHSARARLHASLDRELTLAAQAIPFILADDFHDRASGPASITPAEDRHNIAALTDYACQGGFAYLYTMVEVAGVPRLTASSASADELASGTEVRYFTSFEEGRPLIAALRARDDGRLATTYEDRWGTWRAVLLARHSPEGRPYVVGAELDAAAVHQQLWWATLQSLLTGLLLVAASLPLFLQQMGELRAGQRRLEGAVLERTAELAHLAAHDPLTDVYNRRAFYNLLEQELGGGRADRVFSLAACDLDHFKQINDRYGHEAGDAVLRAFTTAVRQVIRPTDLLGRVGGEEFMVLLPRTSLAMALGTAERMRACVEGLRVEGPAGQPIGVTVSIGVAASDEGAPSIKALVRLADRRLYLAKAAGRNRVVAEDPHDGAAPD